MRSETLALALAALALAAAPLRSKEEPAEPTVDARFRLIAYDAPIDGGYALPRGWVPLLIPCDFFSAEQRYRGPETLSLLRRNAAGAAEPLASVRLKDGARVILLIVPDGSGGRRVISIPDQEGSFPEGTCRFLNLAGRPVSLRTGTDVLPMKPGEDVLIRPVPDARGYTHVELITEKDGKWSTGYSLRGFHEDDVRMLYFVLPGPVGTHAVLIKGIPERKARRPEAPAPGVNGTRPPASR